MGTEQGPGPTVSVVVPVHDAGHHLHEALASVSAQDVGPDVGIEVVVVDDGSTDGAPAEATTRHDVVLLEQANLGPAAARNAGIARARGGLIAFLDADDRWPAGKLRTQLAHLDANPACEVVLGRQEVHLDGIGTLPAWLDRAPAWMPHAWRDRVDGQLPLSSMVVRRGAFDRVGLFDEGLRHAEDVDWLLRAMELGHEVDVLDDIVLDRRLHPGNASHDEAAMTRGVLAALGRRAERHRRAGEVPPVSVSVVIPLRDHADLLAEALASVDRQGRVVREVIVVDDGSDPAHAPVIARTCEGRARLVRQPPLGPAAARNLGARLARGTHLLFLDADDRLAPDGIASLVAGLGAAAPGAASTTSAVGRTREFVDGAPVDGRSPREGLFRLLGAQLLPSHLFRELGGFDERLRRGEAIDLLHRATAHGLTVTEVDAPVLERRLHATNSGHSESADTSDYLTVAHQAILRLRARSRAE